jgi:hypothetical protein
MENPKDIRPILAAIVPHLGTGWRVEIETRGEEGSDYNATRGRIMHDDGRGMYLSLGVTNYGWAPLGKLSIQGVYPRDNDGKEQFPHLCLSGRWNMENPRMNVSASKAPATIARDIERRFLPDYSPLYAALQAQLDARNATRAGLDETMARMCAAFGRSPSSVRKERDSLSASLWAPLGKLGNADVESYTPGEVTLRLSSLPLDLAERIARILAESAGE